MVKIIEMYYGSKLYGTDTPESDTDIKGIYLPSRRDLLLGRVANTINYKSKSDNGRKNNKDDIDIELYSLPYFLKLAMEGQTAALDMLHAPKDMWLNYERNIESTNAENLHWQHFSLPPSNIWLKLVKERKRFFTKNMKAFVGYCKSQASRYGLKGKKLASVEKVLRFLETIQYKYTLKDVWDDLPEGDYIHKYEAAPENNNLRMYEVCGRKLQESVGIFYALNTVNRVVQDYEERVKKAESNSGIDWKALSHVLRVAIELEEIYTNGIIIFPLLKRDYLKKVKAGEVDFDEVIDLIDEYVQLIEKLSEQSIYPEKVDKNYWDYFLLTVYDEWVIR